MSDYPNRPLIGVGVFIFKGPPETPRVLLVRRGKAPRAGQWSVPGGRQRLGETVRAAALREAREETGCAVEITALLDVIDSMTRDDAGALQYHYTLVDFLAEWRNGDVVAGGDVAEACWAAVNDLAPFALWSETLRLIEMGIGRRSVG